MPLSQTGPAWLFCPADRSERFEKAAAAADVVILDLVGSDAVGCERLAEVEVQWVLSKRNREHCTIKRVVD